MNTILKSEKPSRESRWEPVIPTLLCFGPVFMYQGLAAMAASHEAGGTMHFVNQLTTVAGVFALVGGLVFLFARQVRLVRRVEELERQARPRVD